MGIEVVNETARRAAASGWSGVEAIRNYTRLEGSYVSLVYVLREARASRVLQGSPNNT